MDILKNWALCLIAAAAAGTLATVIVPRGSMDKTVRAVVGIFVVAVICSPLAEIKDSDFSVEAFANFGETEYENPYADDVRESMLSSFRKTVETRIKEIASELDVDVVSVMADVALDESGCINIHKIAVAIGRNELTGIEYLSEIISEKLGAPVEIIEE